MNLDNPFSEETRNLFLYNYRCWICGKNTQDALHHILGRQSNSPLNAAPICNFNCHIGNGKLTIFQDQVILLEKTFKFLIENGYELTKKDIDFIEKNKKYYDKIAH